MGTLNVVFGVIDVSIFGLVVNWKVRGLVTGLCGVDWLVLGM